jgi:hypothetical protein
MREEIPNTENGEVADMLGGLKRIEAPENFEFGVKARIAKGEPKGTGSPFTFLKIAIPTAALASLGLFLYLSGFMSGELPTVQVAEDTKPAVTETQDTRHALTQDAVSKEPGPLQNGRESQIASARNVPNKRGGSTDRTESATGGSIDQTLNPDQPILPEGTRARTAAEVLGSLGVNAEFQNDRCVARTVAGGSPAERIGVKRGDVILTLNDTPLHRSTTFKGRVELRSIRVFRAGQNTKLTF